MPALRGENIPRPVGRNQERQSVHPGEVVVTCPRDDCDWRTVRPEHAGPSALEAHRIRHLRGTL